VSCVCVLGLLVMICLIYKNIFMYLTCFMVDIYRSLIFDRCRRHYIFSYFFIFFHPVNKTENIKVSTSSAKWTRIDLP
jgi:hypothetical protein